MGLRARVWYSILVFGRREPCAQDGTGISSMAKLLILDELRCGGVGRGWVNWMDVSGGVSRLNEASLISPSCSNSSPREKGQLA